MLVYLISIKITSIFTILRTNHNLYEKYKTLENRPIIRSSRAYLSLYYIRIQNSVYKKIYAVLYKFYFFREVII